MAGPIRIAVLANASQATKELRGVAGTADSMGSKVASAAKKAALGLAVLGAGAAIKFTKDAAVLDTKMREVVTLFGETGKAAERSLGVVRGQVRTLSDEFGIAQETLTGGLYQAISAGVPRENALEFMRVASKAAIGGVTDVETAVDGLSTTINAFGLEAKDASKVADSMFATVKGGKTNFSELSSSLFNVAPAAAAAGVSFQEVNAAIATLTAGGTPTSVATTQIRAALTGLQRPSADLDKIFQSLGFKNAELAIKSKGLGFALDAVKDASKGSSGELQKLLGSSEAVAAANVLAGTGAKKFTAELKNQKNAAGAAADAFDVVNKSAERQFEILKTNLRNVGLSVGQALLPALAKVSSFLAAEVGPAVDRVTKYLSDNKDEFRETARTVADTVFPVLKTLGEISLGVVGFLAGLPAPVKEFGIQAAIAAIAISKLSTAIAAVKASTFITGITTAETRVASLTKAAKLAAGSAGIAFLTSSLTGAAREGATFGGVMQGVAGGAGIGAMFGPVGALAGAAAGGGLTALVGAFSDTKDGAERTRLELMKAKGFQSAKDGAASLTTALQGVINHYGRVTRAAVEASFTGEDGKLASDIAQLRQMGVSMDTIVSATLGQAGAQRVVNQALGAELNPGKANLATVKAAYDDAKDGAIGLVTATGQVIANGQRVSPEKIAELKAAYESTKGPVENLIAAESTFRDRIEQSTGSLRNHKQLMADLAATLNITLDRYKRFPERVRTHFEAKGLPQTAADAVRLIDRYKALQSFRSIRALVSAPGVDLTRQQVERLGRQYKLTPEQVKTLFKLEGIRDAENESSRGGERVRNNLERSLNQARGKMRRVVPDINTTTTQGASAASAGARGIGNALKSGLPSGFAGADGLWSSLVRSAVRATIAAGRAEADARSPSRKMAALGKDMGDGLTDGLAKTHAQQKKAGQDLVASLLSGVGGSDQVGKALDKIRSLVERTVKHKKDKVESAREREILKHLKDRFAELTKIGKEQDKANARLETAKQKLGEVKQAAVEYRNSIRDAVVASGSIVGLGVVEGEDGAPSTISLGKLLEDLRAKVASAAQYSATLRQLAQAGLNRTSLQQLIDAGPEGGLATAAAIAAGGQAAIKEVNTLTGQLVTTGQGLGTAMSAEFHTAGINAAAALVRGLEKDSAALDLAAKRLARRLAAAVRSELGIKSPSRVFMKIGDNVMEGLAIALDETRAASLGTGTAKSLVRGFGTPSLDSFRAVTGATSTSAAPTTVKIYVTAPVGSSKAEIGAEVKSTLDAYYNSGGRDLAIG